MVVFLSDFRPQGFPPLANLDEALDFIPGVKAQFELFFKLEKRFCGERSASSLEQLEFLLRPEVKAFQLDYFHILRAPKGPWSLYVLVAYMSEI